jgi:hypothetical protein
VYLTGRPLVFDNRCLERPGIRLKKRSGRLRRVFFERSSSAYSFSSSLRSDLLRADMTNSFLLLLHSIPLYAPFPAGCVEEEDVEEEPYFAFK